MRACLLSDIFVYRQRAVLSRGRIEAVVCPKNMERQCYRGLRHGRGKNCQMSTRENPGLEQGTAGFET